jgi:hypothetical protein
VAGLGSHPSSEKAVVTPIAPPSGRQHPHRRDGRSTVEVVGGGSCADGSGAAHVGVESCGA